MESKKNNKKSKAQASAPSTLEKDEWLTAEQKAQYIGYLDKNVPVPGKGFNFTSLIAEGGAIHYEVCLKWWRITLGFNEILFAAQKAEYLKERRELFKSKSPEDHQKWVSKCMYWTMRDISQKKHLLTILVARMGINKDDFDKITK